MVSPRCSIAGPSGCGFGARLLSDTALLRRQSIDRLLRLSILHNNEPPILCLRAERVAVSSQGTRIVFSYRSAGRSFPMRCEYSFHSGRGPCCDGPHCHSYLKASCAIIRISTGVVDPETVASTNSRSKERRSIGRVTRPGAAAERSGRMQIAWPSATTRCAHSSLSVPHHRLDQARRPIAPEAHVARLWGRDSTRHRRQAERR